MTLYQGHNLKNLVVVLPEMYQPIFGHPELSTRVSRKSEDRLAQIIQIYHTLEAKLKRPLRVLDLGCAQGFFSLNLATLGANVVGVDFQPQNIAVCKTLGAEYPDLNVQFQLGLIEEVIAHLEQDHYDLVLGLSVFHHLIHRLGLSSVQEMFFVLADKILAGVYEMALPSEPPDWAVSQPHNPGTLLEGYAFSHEIGRNNTHLSSIDRPLYIASNHYWFLNDQAGKFDTWTTESHALANNASCGTRRYFFGKNYLVKIFLLDFANRQLINVREYHNEVEFLKNAPADFKSPSLMLYGEHATEAWLVRDLLPGELLLDKIISKHTYNAEQVLIDILEQLTILENAGLYHNDVRIWNIIIDENEHAALIDYGAISGEQKDCDWPCNIFLSFMISVREIISANAFLPNPIRPPSFNPEGFPEPYRSIFLKFYELPIREWSFALLQKLFLEAIQGVNLSGHLPSSFSIAFRATEEAYRFYVQKSDNWQHRASLAESLVYQMQQNTEPETVNGWKK